jgi:penicillin-binding protein A
MDPKTGKILAIGGKSSTISEISTHNGFPAASLFKIVTAAAAYYTNNIDYKTNVIFRGGNYTLNKYNFIPNKKTDRRIMSVGEAMSKSCNPVFGRLALELPSPAVLRDFALMFQFGTIILGDFSIPQSEAYIPNSPFELSRTGAGFGRVTISPVHAAALISAIANKGKFPTPQIIEQMLDSRGRPTTSAAHAAKQIIDPQLASALSQMMKQTTVSGTAKAPFTDSHGKSIFPFEIVSKTGTLKGTNPSGLTKWFIAAAPLGDPKIAIAVVVVDPHSTNEYPANIGKKMFDEFF